MGYILLEGLDRVGKSTVAELYKKKGYTVVHMSAPDKKYTQPGYTGPSYLDDMLEMYQNYQGMDVVFDRTVFGEAVWPFVYGRDPHLSEEDFEILQEIEDHNDAERILLVDEDVEAHWERCVANKEPMNRSQFRIAGALYKKMAKNYGFKVMTLSDFVDIKNAKANKETVASSQKEPTQNTNVASTTDSSIAATTVLGKTAKTPEQRKLDQANAINDILSKRVIKFKGDEFDAIEDEVRKFLNAKLGSLFGTSSAAELTVEEVQLLKLMAQRIKDKEKGNK